MEAEERRPFLDRRHSPTKSITWGDGGWMQVKLDPGPERAYARQTSYEIKGRREGVRKQRKDREREEF